MSAMSSWLRKITTLNTGLVSLVIIVIAAFAVIPKTAHAETRITGEPRELSLEAYDTTLQEVLTALRSSFGLKIQASTSTDLNRSVSGTYNGSLREVITRLLDGYDFFVRKLGDDLEVVVVGFSASSGIAPPPEVAAPIRRPALRRDF